MMIKNESFKSSHGRVVRLVRVAAKLFSGFRRTRSSHSASVKSQNNLPWYVGLHNVFTSS